MLDSVFDDFEVKREEVNQRRQENWEERVVKRILGAKGLSQTTRELAVRHHDLTGVFKITFADFLVEYGDFPVYLHCRKIPYLHKLTYEDLFKKQTRLSIVKTLAELEPEVPRIYEDMPHGVVFEWLHSGGQFKVIHNYDMSRRHGVQISIPTPSATWPDSALIVQNLDDFLIGIHWSEKEK